MAEDSEFEMTVTYRGVKAPVNIRDTFQLQLLGTELTHAQRRLLAGFKAGVDATLRQLESDKLPIGHKFTYPDDIPEYVTALRIARSDSLAWRVGEGWLYAPTRDEAEQLARDGISPWSLDEGECPCYAYEVK